MIVGNTLIWANELAQWAALLFVGFIALGLLRQLGFFLAVDERRAPEGPRIGQDLPLALVPASARAQARRNRASDPVSLLVAVLVLDDSESSEAIVHIVEELGDRLPCVVVARGLSETSPKFADWSDTFDYVVADPNGELSSLARLTSTPFLLVTDDHFTVRYKIGSANLERTVRNWLETETPTDTEVIRERTPVANT